jgi:hypothetical protein
LQPQYELPELTENLIKPDLDLERNQIIRRDREARSFERRKLPVR